MFKFDYTMSDDDHLEYIKYLIKNNPEYKKAFFNYRLRLFLSLLMLLGFCILSGAMNLYMWIFFGVIFLLSAFFIIFATRKIFTRAHINRYMSACVASKDKYSQERTIEFEENDITYRTDSYTLFAHCRAIEVFFQNDESGDLYMQLAGRLIVLPSRIFSSGEERSAVAEYIKSKIAENAQVISKL